MPTECLWVRETRVGMAKGKSAQEEVAIVGITGPTLIAVFQMIIFILCLKDGGLRGATGAAVMIIDNLPPAVGRRFKTSMNRGDTACHQHTHRRCDDGSPGFHFAPFQNCQIKPPLLMCCS